MITRVLRLALVVAAGIASATFAGLALLRLGYPLELDYIEGVMMDHVVRLAHGQPLYVKPGLDFITLAYMPGFATLASLLARVFGAEFWVPRLISVVSMLTIAAIVVWVLRRETRSWTLGLAGAGILLGSYGITGGHFDVGRPDSLMLCLSLLGLTTLRFTTAARGAVIAGLLLTAAFFTKQHAVWFGIAAFAHLLINDRARLKPFAATWIVGCAGGYLLLSLWLGPWFSFYTWEIPSRWSQISKVRILNYVGKGLLGSHALVVLPAILSLGLTSRPWRGRDGLWMWAGLGGIATGFMATLDPDAFRHVMNPTVMTFAILGPLSLWRIGQAMAPEAQRPAPTPAVVYLVLLLQFIPLIYAVRAHLPHPDAQGARVQLEKIMREHDGPVLMLYHGYYASLAGKGTHLQQISIDDIIRAPGNRLLRRDPDYFVRLLAPLREPGNRTMIITDVRLDHSGSESRALWEELASHYRLAGDLGNISRALNPVDGNHWTPRYIYLPLAPGQIAPPDSASIDPDPEPAD